jgi:hypothetical protein
MASFDVYFRAKLQNVPRGISVLLDSAYDLSFLDNSQIWPENSSNDVTHLNVVISDYAPAAHDMALIPERFLAELRHYITFNYDPHSANDDVDRERCHFQTNIGQPLFLNEVGSWENRPEAKCAIPNLFIAGDYCQTFIDVVSVEAAVVSGLVAAEAVRERARTGDPIKIVHPETYPRAALAALRTMSLPYAYAAKAWSVLSGALHSTR